MPELNRHVSLHKHPMEPFRQVATQGICLLILEAGEPHERGNQWVTHSRSHCNTIFLIEPSLFGYKGYYNDNNWKVLSATYYKYYSVVLWLARLKNKTRHDFPKSLWAVWLPVCSYFGVLLSYPVSVHKHHVTGTKQNVHVQRYLKMCSEITFQDLKKLPWKSFNKACKNNRVEKKSTIFYKWTFPIWESNELCPLEIQSNISITYN